MADARWERIKAVFSAAMELAPEDRAALLDKECAGDPELRREVESLLSARTVGAVRTAGAARAMADSPTATGGSTALTEGPGTRIGPYKLLQLIGEGGFGSVFMAEQERPLRRRVALKIIKLGMDTRAVIARFEAERQALAMMEHPNIAKVLDAGATESGRPYFVMELVRGVPITEYCDTANLSAPERLELVIPVCQAVQHAHQKGIIHRDLKPSNILVTLHDGKPVPKVIDFGIAKATASRLTEMTLFTEHRQLIGTPAYMSPEQAEMSGLDIDTRADIYSLGVLLYELLTGATPFDTRRLMEAGFAEIQRVIREVEPQKPSTRVSTLGEGLASVAAKRNTEPRRLGMLLRGDLDWIVMKALEKDRGRRYDTATGLAEDIRRHLSGEPVLAAPPSAGYRVRKFVRRNRGKVVTAGLVGGAVLAGSVGVSFGALELQASNARLREVVEKENDALQRLSMEATGHSPPRMVRSTIEATGEDITQDRLLGGIVDTGLAAIREAKQKRVELEGAISAFRTERVELVDSLVRTLAASGMYPNVRLDSDGTIRDDAGASIPLALDGRDWHTAPLQFSIPKQIEEKMQIVVDDVRKQKADLAHERDADVEALKRVACDLAQDQWDSGLRPEDGVFSCTNWQPAAPGSRSVNAMVRLGKDDKPELLFYPGQMTATPAETLDPSSVDPAFVRGVLSQLTDGLRDALRAETKRALLIEADAIMERQTHASEEPGYRFPSLDELHRAVESRTAYCGSDATETIDAQFALGLAMLGEDNEDGRTVIRESLDRAQRSTKVPLVRLIELLSEGSRVEQTADEFDRADALNTSLADACDRLADPREKLPQSDDEPWRPLIWKLNGYWSRQSAPREPGALRAFAQEVRAQRGKTLRSVVARAQCVWSLDRSATAGGPRPWLESLDYARRSVAADPECAECAAALALACYRNDQYPDALAAGATAGKLMGDGKAASPYLLAAIAMTQQRIGQHEKAIDALNQFRALMRDPKNAETWAVSDSAKALMTEAEALIDPHPPAVIPK